MIEVVEGSGPIVLGLPHTGTDMPEEIRVCLNDTGRALADTDWHIDHLYKGLLDDVTTVRTRIHRYVIDVNRSETDESLYPGQNTTGLCPVTDFDGAPIYRAGAAPDAAEVARRTQIYHRPYHDALQAQIARVRARHGCVVLYDCHSIRSVIPHLFPGRLPDFNIGTNLGVTCAKTVEQQVLDICSTAEGYTTVLNGRFKGGWTTRAYGQPDQGVHAIQMELAQSTYMTEAPPWRWSAPEAEKVRPILSFILSALRDLSTNGDLS